MRGTWPASTEVWEEFNLPRGKNWSTLVIFLLRVILFFVFVFFLLACQFFCFTSWGLLWNACNQWGVQPFFASGSETFVRTLICLVFVRHVNGGVFAIFSSTLIGLLSESCNMFFNYHSALHEWLWLSILICNSKTLITRLVWWTWTVLACLFVLPLVDHMLINPMRMILITDFLLVILFNIVLKYWWAVG